MGGRAQRRSGVKPVPKLIVLLHTFFALDLAGVNILVWFTATADEPAPSPAVAVPVVLAVLVLSTALVVVALPASGRTRMPGFSVLLLSVAGMLALAGALAAAVVTSTGGGGGAVMLNLAAGGFAFFAAFGQYRTLQSTAGRE